MAPKAAPAELELETPDVDDGTLEDWGLEGIGEEDDEDEETPGERPEADESDDPAEGDEPDAPVEDDVDLPGDEPDELTEAETPAVTSPSAEADRSKEEPTAEVPEVKPWVVKADGKEIEVPRSQVFKAKNADGSEEEYVLFPAAEIQKTLHNHLADRTVWREEKKGLLEQLAERDPQHNEDVVKARELTTFLWDLLGKSDDELLEAVDKLRQGKPVWEAQQEAKAAKAQLEARGTVKIDPDPELQKIQTEEFVNELQGSLRRNVAELLKRPEFAGLDPDEVFEDLWELKNNVFFEADEDLPQVGLRKGDYGIDLDYIGTRLQREAARIARVRESTARAKEIERENAERLGNGRKPAAAARPSTERRRKPKDEEVFDVDAFLNDTDDI